MEGLDKFREAFLPFSDSYVIIGGTACEMVLSGTAMRPRATHDIDMIIVIEKLVPEFGSRFWDFIKEGQYRPEKYKPAEGEAKRYQLYRFVDGLPGYPQMIELLARHHDVLGEPKGLLIEPIPFDRYVSSLSAIIMDDDFYNFTVKHSVLTDGIRHADASALIALKAKAYLNLQEMKASNKHVNTRDIKKHRSDVMKNLVVMPQGEVPAPQSVVDIIHAFVESLRQEWDTLASALATALEMDESSVTVLLDILDNTFTPES
ncbi:MAG: hypothetical protein LIP02_06160 [Bacteroidales bacterium]|nr:hypothetical protein [Bacteroidales bacterium]